VKRVADWSDSLRLVILGKIGHDKSFEDPEEQLLTPEIGKMVGKNKAVNPHFSPPSISGVFPSQSDVIHNTKGSRDQEQQTARFST
jgi:hypothetical protein